MTGLPLEAIFEIGAAIAISTWWEWRRQARVPAVADVEDEAESINSLRFRLKTASNFVLTGLVLLVCVPICVGLQAVLLLAKAAIGPERPRFRWLQYVRSLNRQVSALVLYRLLSHGSTDAPWPSLKLQRSQSSSQLKEALTRYRDLPSAVHPASLDEVCLWLKGCEYWASGERDPDAWLTEIDEFEHTRRGDCKAHAWWAWKQLSRLGYSVRLVRGYSSQGRGHAWVTFQGDDGEEYLLESTEKQLDQMIRPIAKVCANYQPHWAMDDHLSPVYYAGFYREQLRRPLTDPKKQPRPNPAFQRMPGQAEAQSERPAEPGTAEREDR